MAEEIVLEIREDDLEVTLDLMEMLGFYPARIEVVEEEA